MTDLTLVEETKVWWKLWSIRLGALATAIMAVFIGWPETMLFVWQAMPYEVRMLMPPRYAQFIGLFIYVLAMLARFIKQKKLKQNATAK